MTVDPSAALPLVRKSLENLTSSFAADDYRLSVDSLCDGVLKLTVEAGASACAECLVPENILIPIIRNNLAREVLVSKIEIKYPFSGK